MIRVAIFTDNDFDKVNGVTTTLKAVLRHTPADIAARVYTASDVDADRSDYFAVKSRGMSLPWYREMRIRWPHVGALERRVQEDGADVIHVTTPGPVGLAARVIAGRLGLPMTGSFHANLGDRVATSSGIPSLGRVVDRYIRWVYRGCDPLLVPSSATRRLLEGRGYAADGLQLWSRGVDADLFSPERRSLWMRRFWGVSAHQPAILYVGRLSRDQGLDLLPAIQHELASWGLAHRFILVGDGPMAAELRRLCPDAVFLGCRSHADVAVAMASADAFLFPSATDTLGNVVLEAQASGLPVVVSDRGGPHEQMSDGETGWIAPAGRGPEFADRLRAILIHADVHRAMGQQARAFALTRTWAQSLTPLAQAWRRAARHRSTVPRPIGGPAPSAHRSS